MAVTTHVVFVNQRNLNGIIREQPEVRRRLEQVGTAIARDTAELARDPLYRPKVSIARGKVKVFTRYWFAHLDEWGSVNNPPTGAMRRAAARYGRFVPSPKGDKTDTAT